MLELKTLCQTWKVTRLSLVKRSRVSINLLAICLILFFSVNTYSCACKIHPMQPHSCLWFHFHLQILFSIIIFIISCLHKLSSETCSLDDLVKATELRLFFIIVHFVALKGFLVNEMCSANVFYRSRHEQNTWIVCRSCFSYKKLLSCYEYLCLGFEIGLYLFLI